MGMLDWLDSIGLWIKAEPAPAPPPIMIPPGGKLIDGKAVTFDGLPFIPPLIHGPGASEAWNTPRGADSNSAVFACLNAICTAYPEAPVRVFRIMKEDRDLLSDHPLQKLLDRPNPFHSSAELWYWVNWAKHVEGNAYLRKIRSGDRRGGNVLELWPVSPLLMTPITYRGSRNFIDAYRHEVEPGKFDDVPVENVVHFRLGVDPTDTRRGLAPLRRLVRSIATDQEAQRFTQSLLGK
jgi:phage portal protein BeeE